MRIIGIDTAAKGCSVAIVEGETLLSEVTKVSSHTHAIHLMGMIHDAMDLGGIGIHDLDGFAVTHGPGSFTGLRIGISAVKGLASALDKPAVGVSSLQVLAMQLIPCSSRTGTDLTPGKRRPSRCPGSQRISSGHR